MADVQKIVDEVKKLSLTEVSELVKALEDEFGVSAATPVMAAAPAAGGDAAAPAEEQSEFEKVALTEQFEKGIDAPFVGESQAKFALELREIKPLEINGTVLVIGEITHIIVPDIALCKDGYIDIEALDTVAISGLDSYHTTDRLGRLSYAKPNTKSQLLNIEGDVC